MFLGLITLQSMGLKHNVQDSKKRHSAVFVLIGGL